MERQQSILFLVSVLSTLLVTGTLRFLLLISPPDQYDMAIATRYIEWTRSDNEFKQDFPALHLYHPLFSPRPWQQLRLEARLFPTAR